MTSHYFPDADEPALQPFTQAFVGMMFAHAASEHRVSDLMDVITGVAGFGERPDNQWSADQRPKRMKRLIREYHPDGLPETDGLVACLKRSIPFSRTRNLLAHGKWWEFDLDADTITVRSGVARSGQDQHRPITVADIRHVARRTRSGALETSARYQGSASTGPPASREMGFNKCILALADRAIMIVRRPSGFIEPCQPSRVARPPSGPLWVHEIKHDGYRLMVRRDGARVRCFTRNGHDWPTASRPSLTLPAASRRNRS
jgi:hypothetical protein